MCNLKKDHIFKIYDIGIRLWREKENHIMFNFTLFFDDFKFFF